MEYSVVDPSAYGIKIRSTLQTSTSVDVTDKENGDKDSGDARRNSPSARPSSTSSVALHTASDASQITAHLVGETRYRGVTHKQSSSLTTSPIPSSTVSPHPPKREPASTNQQEKLEARKQRLEESRKRMGGFQSWQSGASSHKGDESK